MNEEKMNDQTPNKEDAEVVISPNSQTIPCKGCVYAAFLGYMKKACEKYKEKPDEIYYKSKPCLLRKQEGGDE